MLIHTPPPFLVNKKDYIMKPVGNPDGDDKPNKKYFE